MAKFIIEVSDEYIRDCADPDKIHARIVESVEKCDVLAAFADILTFSNLKRALDEGVSEFVLSEDKVADDEKSQSLFKNALRCFAVLKLSDSAETKNKQSENVETKA